MNEKLLICSVVIAVLINLLLPMIAKKYATPAQKNPPSGGKNLPFFDQIVHMLYHHSEVPVSSSLIVAVIVGLSVVLGEMCIKKRLI